MKVPFRLHTPLFRLETEVHPGVAAACAVFGTGLLLAGVGFFVLGPAVAAVVAGGSAVAAGAPVAVGPVKTSLALAARILLRC
jgi:hypothetical protein